MKGIYGIQTDVEQHCMLHLEDYAQIAVTKWHLSAFRWLEDRPTFSRRSMAKI